MKQYAYISTAYTSDNFGWKEEVISEDSRGAIKAMILEGEFQRAEAKNRNGRVYSEALLMRETNRLKEFIKERNGFPMSMDHPLPGDDKTAMTLIQRMGLNEAAGLCTHLEMNNKIVQNNFYTTIELAKELGISKVSVLKRIWKGSIKGQKMGRNFVIFKKDVNLKKMMAIVKH